MDKTTAKQATVAAIIGALLAIAIAYGLVQYLN